MNTDTPETDSAYIQRPNEGAWDFRVRQEKTMEKLERERDEAREELTAVTEQRDRLAVAITSIASGAVYEARCIEIAREVLQSLTNQNEL